MIYRVHGDGELRWTLKAPARCVSGKCDWHKSDGTLQAIDQVPTIRDGNPIGAPAACTAASQTKLLPSFGQFLVAGKFDAVRLFDREFQIFDLLARQCVLRLAGGELEKDPLPPCPGVRRGVPEWLLFLVRAIWS